MNTITPAAPVPANDVGDRPAGPYAHYATVLSRVFQETGSLEVALEVLDAHRAREALAPARPDLLEQVLTVSGSLFGVPRKRILERNRHTHFTSARYVAAWLLRRRRWSTTKIGEALGLDHSTVLSGLRKVANATDLLVAAHKAELLLEPADAAVDVDALRAAG